MDSLSNDLEDAVNVFGHLVFSNQDRIDYMPIFMSHENVQKLRQDNEHYRRVQTEEQETERIQRRSRLPEVR